MKQWKCISLAVRGIGQDVLSTTRHAVDHAKLVLRKTESAPPAVAAGDTVGKPESRPAAGSLSDILCRLERLDAATNQARSRNS
jgi:hypothetical protein